MNTIISVGEEDIGKRIDVLIKQKLNLKSRAEAKKIINSTSISSLNKIKASHLVKYGEVFTIHNEDICINEKKITPKPNSNIHLDIKYEDEHLVIINKQANLSVHLSKSEQTNTLVNAILQKYGSQILQLGTPDRAGIVHRIDKDTSGLIIVAKSQESYQKLKKMFAERMIKKIYTAVVYGVINPLEGTLSGYISKSKKNYKKFVIANEGKFSLTHYKTIKIINKMSASILELILETGRTHQIRCQLENISHSIIGDALYSKNKLLGVNNNINPEKLIKRQALHSTKIEFFHPINNSYIIVESELPQDIKNLINTIDI